MLVDITPENIGPISAIADKERFFPPDITSPLTIVKVGLYDEEDGKVVGSAYVTVTCDLTFSIDSALSGIKKGKLLKETIEKLKPVLIEKGLVDCQVFCLTEEMAKVLEKHFNFKQSVGIAMNRGLLEDGKSN